MKMTQVISFCLAALVLVVSGVAINAGKLWSLYSNMTIPWFVTAMAVALVIVCLTALLAGKPVSEIPVPTLVIVALIATLIPFFGIILDAWGNWFTEAYVTSLGEVVGFAIILLAFFLVPRIGSGDDEMENPVE